jgi:hypothetical protein
MSYVLRTAQKKVANMDNDNIQNDPCECMLEVERKIDAENISCFRRVRKRGMENDGISFDDQREGEVIGFARRVVQGPNSSILVVAAKGNAPADALFLR